jgi:hypothetical protein
MGVPEEPVGPTPQHAAFPVLEFSELFNGVTERLEQSGLKSEAKHLKAIARNADWSPEWMFTQWRLSVLWCIEYLRSRESDASATWALEYAKQTYEQWLETGVCAPRMCTETVAKEIYLNGNYFVRDTRDGWATGAAYHAIVATFDPNAVFAAVSAAGTSVNRNAHYGVRMPKFFYVERAVRERKRQGMSAEADYWLQFSRVLSSR